MAPAKPKKRQNRVSNVKKRLLEVPSERDNTKPAVRPRIQNPTKEGVGRIQRLAVFRSIPKHSRFYYDDGSVIFVTEQRGASPATLFRVSRRQLESASKKLRVIFEEAFDQQENGDQKTEMYEGCPVLRLEESTEDVAALFEVLWGGLYTGVEDRTHQFVTGVLSLSTKWDIPHLQTWSMNYLETKIPTTYEQFTAHPNFITSSTLWIGSYHTLKLHHDFKLPKMAAITWYRLSCVSWEKFEESQTRSWFRPAAAFGEHVHMEKLVVGRERIHGRCFNFFFGDGQLSKIGRSTCKNLVAGRQCTSLLPILSQVRSSESDLKTCFKNPLGWAQTWKSPTSTTCEYCQTALSSAVQCFGRELFDDLPKIFNV